MTNHTQNSWHGNLLIEKERKHWVNEKHCPNQIAFGLLVRHTVFVSVQTCCPLCIIYALSAFRIPSKIIPCKMLFCIHQIFLDHWNEFIDSRRHRFWIFVWFHGLKENAKFSTLVLLLVASAKIRNGQKAYYIPLFILQSLAGIMYQQQALNKA
jgi:hypothetical protein